MGTITRLGVLTHVLSEQRNMPALCRGREARSDFCSSQDPVRAQCYEDRSTAGDLTKLGVGGHQGRPPGGGACHSTSDPRDELDSLGDLLACVTVPACVQEALLK